MPRALADPQRVRQIVSNLLSNAHLYTGEGGRLSVSVRPDNGSVALAISDSGRGMRPEELEHIWDRFVRREDGAGGTGLGLSIVRSLVDVQGGSIDVTSEPGSGTTFTVHLPAEPDADGAESPRSAIKGKRVLIVDDEPAVAALVAEQLKPFEVETETVHSGEEALARLREGQFDAMTLDVLMPDRSGLDVLRAVRSDPQLRRTPVVVVSILSGLGGARAARARPGSARARPRVGHERNRGGAGVRPAPLRGRPRGRGHPQSRSGRQGPRPARPAPQPGGGALLHR
jgi:CheY-like chemotaxis protein